jgi:SAM-dependent methyltransferase
MKTFNPSYTQDRPDIRRLIPPNVRTVLDLGCATGSFGAKLKEINPDVLCWGIESDAEMAKIAKTKLQKVFVSDLVYFDYGLLPKKYFDCVVCGDVLEHLINPVSVVHKLKDTIKEDGYILVSLPNVSHISVICNLILFDNWPWRDEGIFDRTHLRWFTRRSFSEIMTIEGFECVKEDRNIRLDYNGISWFDRFSRFFDIRPFRRFITYQFLQLYKISDKV